MTEQEEVDALFKTITLQELDSAEVATGIQLYDALRDRDDERVAQVLMWVFNNRWAEQ
ncbi:MAG: hypothetical protein NTX33_04725 [Propionibacteriales bacterium]|nr:hypothetical protein [Propionibacteriales bacterium]